MVKFLVIVYLIVFATYVLFTREPDFFGSATAHGTIHFAKDSAGEIIPFASYRVDSLVYKTDARYLFRNMAEGDKTEIIYAPEHPEKGAVYNWWGYWVTWQELLASIGLLVLLFQIAKAITRNPTPEGLLSELEDTAPKKQRRYS